MKLHLMLDARAVMDTAVANHIVAAMWRSGIGQYRPRYMRGHFYFERHWFLQRFMMEKPGVRLRLPS